MYGELILFMFVVGFVVIVIRDWDDWCVVELILV